MVAQIQRNCSCPIYQFQYTFSLYSVISHECMQTFVCIFVYSVVLNEKMSLFSSFAFICQQCYTCRLCTRVNLTECHKLCLSASFATYQQISLKKAKKQWEPRGRGKKGERRRVVDRGIFYLTVSVCRILCPVIIADGACVKSKSALLFNGIGRYVAIDNMHKSWNIWIQQVAERI